MERQAGNVEGDGMAFTQVVLAGIASVLQFFVLSLSPESRIRNCLELVEPVIL